MSMPIPKIAAYSLNFGMISAMPNPISHTPLNKTQNRGLPSISGTIGKYHSGLIKWSMPILMNANPKMNERMFLTIPLPSIVPMNWTS